MNAPLDGDDDPRMLTRVAKSGHHPEFLERRGNLLYVKAVDELVRQGEQPEGSFDAKGVMA